LLSLIESGTGVCTQVPTCHSLLQQPTASAPRPATRPATATKQQQAAGRFGDGTAPCVDSAGSATAGRQMTASGIRRRTGGQQPAAAPAASTRRHRRLPAAESAPS